MEILDDEEKLDVEVNSDSSSAGPHSLLEWVLILGVAAVLYVCVVGLWLPEKFHKPDIAQEVVPIGFEEEYAAVVSLETMVREFEGECQKLEREMSSLWVGMKYRSVVQSVMRTTKDSDPLTRLEVRAENVGLALSVRLCGWLNQVHAILSALEGEVASTSVNTVKVDPLPTPPSSMTERKRALGFRIYAIEAEAMAFADDLIRALERFDRISAREDR